MSDVVDLSALQEKLQKLTQDEGLWREDLAYQLGLGLREMWRIGELDSFDNIREFVFGKFETAIASLPNSGVSDLKLATRISYNIATEIVGLKDVKQLGERQSWLDKQHRNRNLDRSKLPPIITRDYCRRHVPTVAIPHLARVFGAEWIEFAPGKDFPRDVQSKSGGKIRTPKASQSAEGVLRVHPTPSLAAQLKAYAHQPFVERSHYAQRFQQLVDQEYRRIVFNGGRGNGKSRLALELVARQPKALEDGIFIDASSANTLNAELRSIAASRDKSADDPVQAFIELVSAPDAPSYVILDNLEDPHLLKDLLLSDSRSTIVITANRKIPQYEASSLEVTPMRELETVDLIQKLRPTLNEQERQRVAKALGHRPLAVVHACGYIIGGGSSVDDFLSALKSNAARVLRIPALAGEPTLTAIYALILVQLEQLLHDEHPVKARELLELVACVASEDIPSGLLRDVMGPDDRLNSMMFEEAVLALQTRFLVRMVDYRVAIHPLTQEILRGLLREYGKEQAICLRLYRPIQRMLQGEARDTVANDLVIDRMSHICKIVAGLQKVDVSVFREIHLSHTLAVILRGVRQIRLKRSDLDSVFDETADVIMATIDNISEQDDDARVFFDVREVDRELTLAFYSAGEKTSSEYLEEVAGVLSITNGMTDFDDIQQYERLSAPDLIDLCTALLACGRCSAVIDILHSQEGRVGKFFQGVASSGNDKTLGSEFLEETIQYADYKTLETEAWITKAEWPEAKDALDMASRLYGYGGRDMRAVRGRAKTLKLLGDLARMCGKPENLASLEERINPPVYSLRLGWHKDALSASYALHFHARRLTAEYLELYYLWWQCKDDPQLAERSKQLSRDCAKKSDTAGDFLRLASREYLTGYYIRENCDLAYERILLVGLECPDEIDEIVGICAPKKYKIADDPLLQLRIEVARFKVATLHGDDPDVSAVILNRLAEYGEALSGTCEAEYWLAEVLAAMCVLLTLLDSPDADTVLGELRGVYNKLGRQDRLTAVEKATDAWRAGSRQQFKREFAYLLTF